MDKRVPSTSKNPAASRARPEFGHLRKVTSDHVDSAALDPDEHHHPHDDIEEEEEDEHHDDRDDDSSERTLQEQAQNDQETARRRTANQSKDSEKGNQGGQDTSNGNAAKEKPDQHKDLEKGNNVRQRKRAETQASGKWQDPETRAWKDDIVTFNSKDDPENPQNWPYRRKVTVVALYGMTTMCSTFASSVFSKCSCLLPVDQQGRSQTIVVA
jgi:hypothetical protein